jgi:predicted RNA-binding Zn ribbon-like protein
MNGTELVRDFVNTRELLEETEVLTSPGALVSWLAAHGLVDENARGTGTDLREAVDLREALRKTLLANNGVAVESEAAFGVLDRVARRARVELRFRGGAGELAPEVGGITGGLGRIVVAAYGAMADGSWLRLKACRASDCEWAFVDHAKNHSRAWCSMSSCGNREKARTFRERRRGHAASAGDQESTSSR